MFRVESLIFMLIWSEIALAAPSSSPSKVHALYNSLDPKSLPQHLAFYELYRDFPEGQQALKDAWRLLSGSTNTLSYTAPPTLPTTIESILSLVNKQPDAECIQIDPIELIEIEKISAWLPHRKLKGHQTTSEQAVLALPSEEIDLARGLLLSQLPVTEDQLAIIRSYEALLDLMALQILTKLDLQAPPEKKIRAISSFIFDEMGYRFPPHSLYAKDIDLYTFLPSVLDSRRGVCLGVSILYLCLAQRLDLPLEIITPPGHIYVRYRNGDKIINIETTARGIHLDSEEYLGIETRALQHRSIKDVIGLAHFNQASVYWQQENYAKALASYRKATPYLINDMLLKELMGYNAILVGNIDEGKALLEQVKDHLPDFAVSKQTVAEDFLNGFAEPEDIKPLFMYVDETRESIIKKRMALEKVVERQPKFRAALFGLAVTWLQLHRFDEALSVLEKYHQLDSTDPSAEYYLAAIYAERMHYNKAWEHLHEAESITAKREHDPKALNQFRKELSHLCPE